MHETTSAQALDRAIARDYVRHLVDAQKSDTPHARLDFCRRAQVHPKLLHFNPHIREIASLFGEGSNLERLLDMTLRDYLQYHHHFIHLGSRYGASHLQQRWLGGDIAKSPWDCWIYQEIIWETRPDVIIDLGGTESGAAHFLASLMDLIGHGEVVVVDAGADKAPAIDKSRVSCIAGSSLAPATIAEVRRRVDRRRALVFAGSDIDKRPVLEELRAYAAFVPVGGYLIAENSIADILGHHPFPNEGAQQAVTAFLAESDNFVADRRFAERYVLTLNPDGYLKRIKP